MKKSVRFSVIIALELIALEIGAYSYAALSHRSRLHVLLLTVILCLLAALIGTIATRPKAQIASLRMITLGVVAVGIGLFFLFALDYHERASTALGTGILCLLGGLTGISIPRFTIAIFSGILVFGIVTFSVGLYFSTISGYQGRAYIVIGTSILCLLTSLVGIIVTQYRAYTQAARR